MRKVMLVYENVKQEKYAKLLKQIELVFQDLDMEVTYLCFEYGRPELHFSALLSKEIDYICTLDMAGFAVDTLLDTPAYNMITAKQIHIVVDEAVMSLYGKFDMALNLFLFLPGETAKWQEQYPHIPGINTYSQFEADAHGVPVESEYNMTVLRGMIVKVIEETDKR